MVFLLKSLLDHFADCNNLPVMETTGARSNEQDFRDIDNHCGISIHHTILDEVIENSKPNIFLSEVGLCLTSKLYSILIKRYEINHEMVPFQVESAV